MNGLYKIFVILFVLLFTNCGKSKLNLDFEDGLSPNWFVYGNQTGFSVSLDSTIAKSGKYSIAMEFTGDVVDYRGFIYKLPIQSSGGKISLSGYIKTENVTDGFAGLWLMVDSDFVWKPFELSFMEQYGITGTNDWKRYELTLDLPRSNNSIIEIGGLLSGKGKMWMDSLHISIDGELYLNEDSQEKRIEELDIHSHISIRQLSQQNIRDLELLGRIWGFLKYHHPAIAKGNYDWDRELFKFLPILLEATNQKQRDTALIQWIKQYGKIHSTHVNQQFVNKTFQTLSWMDDFNLDDDLKRILTEIYNNRNQGFNYYIQKRSYIQNPIFTNEKSYMGKEHLPDTGFRLLSLFRYWNMINYFYPYKYLTDKDWDTILQEYIPAFIYADSRLKYEQVSARLMNEVCDSHAVLQEGWEKMEMQKGDKQVPISVRFVENQLIVMESDCPELKRGDIITHIEGKPISMIIDSLKAYYPASNDMQKRMCIAKDIIRTHNNTLLLQCMDAYGSIQKKEINTQNRIHILDKMRNKKKDIVGYTIIDKHIGYVNLSAVKKEDIPFIKRELANTDGIIIDLRIFPPDIFHLLAPFFVSETRGFARHTWINPDTPGEFVLSPVYKIPKSRETYKGKLIVIVNEDTESNAEFAAMAFRAGNRTTIIGSNTGGYDGNISQIVLPGGLVTYISGNGVYYPDGGETQRIGIVPDMHIEPTIKGIRENRDELLEHAICMMKER